eukprot:TRINITY_DN259_c4_g1_i1.p1 TRINITY_DN259_c4_g1~~TRINITY_DN259_c4_g1_i1.p1  ORF type:complete len:955 (+),score=205.76 TRINITY_DN259_c4_g1_i1:238-3102(+)
MEVRCDYCGEGRAIVYCRADSARLCLSCDRHVHSANALSVRHPRTLLCDGCNLQPATVRCQMECLSFCPSCDWETHGAKSSASSHKRHSFDSFTGCPSAADLAMIWGCEMPSDKVGVAAPCLTSAPQYPPQLQTGAARVKEENGGGVGAMRSLPGLPAVQGHRMWGAFPPTAYGGLEGGPKVAQEGPKGLPWIAEQQQPQQFNSNLGSTSGHGNPAMLPSAVPPLQQPPPAPAPLLNPQHAAPRGRHSKQYKMQQQMAQRAQEQLHQQMKQRQNHIVMQQLLQLHEQQQVQVQVQGQGGGASSQLAPSQAAVSQLSEGSASYMPAPRAQQQQQQQERKAEQEMDRQQLLRRNMVAAKEQQQQQLQKQQQQQQERQEQQQQQQQKQQQQQQQQQVQQQHRFQQHEQGARTHEQQDSVLVSGRPECLDSAAAAAMGLLQLSGGRPIGVEEVPLSRWPTESQEPGQGLGRRQGKWGISLDVNAPPRDPPVLPTLVDDCHTHSALPLPSTTWSRVSASSRRSSSSEGYRRSLAAARVASCDWSDVATMKILSSAGGDARSQFRPRQFEYSPLQPQLMVAGTLQGEVLVLSHDSGRVIGCVPSIGAPHSILGLCWLNRDPAKLIGGCDNGSVQLYDVNHMRAQQLLQQQPLLPLSARRRASVGASMAVASATLEGVRAGALAYPSHPPPHPAVRTYEDFEQLTSVHVNCSDELFLASGYTNDVGLYDLGTSRRLRIFPNLHEEHINVVKFAHHSPHLFATSSFDRTVKLWDLRQPIAPSRPRPVFCCLSANPTVMVCFSPDDHFLLSSALDNEVRQYLAADGRLHLQLDLKPTGSVHNYTRSYYLNGRDYIISGSCEENAVHVCCARTGRQLRDIVFEASGSPVVTGGAGGQSLKKSPFVQSLRGDPFKDFHLSVLVAYHHPMARSEIVKVSLMGNNDSRTEETKAVTAVTPSTTGMGA